MKQILTILVLFFLFSGNAFAFDVCEHEKKYSQIWYGNNCDNNLLQSTDQKFKKKTKISNPPQSLIDSRVFKEINFSSIKKYKTYKKLPCNFNGAKIDSPAAIAFKKSSRCSKAKGYPLKRGTSILVKRGTPVFAVTDMKLLYAKDRSAKQRSRIYNKTQKKQGIDYIFDDVELMFVDKNQNQILFYHLMDTPFVPGFGKGKCERPLEFGTERYKRNPNYCGGYSNKIINNEMWVLKGDLIGHSGTTGNNSKGDPHISFSFIINEENLTDKEKKLCDLQIKRNLKQKECRKSSPTYCYECYVAPEISKKFKWENFPTDNSEYYLLPIINKKYYKKIGYKK